MENEKQVDVIDRKALLKTLDRYINPMPDKEGYHFLCGLSTAITEIEDAPTVDAVEVVHAHWVYDGDEVDGNMQAHCSNCFAGDVHATWKKNNIPYCWNCGAKMDGDGNG